MKRSGWSAPKDSGLWRDADGLCARLMSELPDSVAALLKTELEYFNSITEVSGKLYPVPKVTATAYEIVPREGEGRGGGLSVAQACEKWELSWHAQPSCP